MTKVVFFRNDGIFYGFREQGHTGYGEEGYDILCAALSSMSMLIINSVNVVFAGELDYTVDEGATERGTPNRKSKAQHSDSAGQRSPAVAGRFSSYDFSLYFISVIGAIGVIWTIPITLTTPIILIYKSPSWANSSTAASKRAMVSAIDT